MDAVGIQGLAAAGVVMAGVSLLLVLAVYLSVSDLKGRVRGILDDEGMIRQELIESTKGKDQDEKLSALDKHVANLEAALREAAGAIQRHDVEMQKILDRVLELESQETARKPTSPGHLQQGHLLPPFLPPSMDKAQQQLDVTVDKTQLHHLTVGNSILSPETSFERDLNGLLAKPADGMEGMWTYFKSITGQQDETQLMASVSATKAIASYPLPPGQEEAATKRSRQTVDLSAAQIRTPEVEKDVHSPQNSMLMTASHKASKDFLMTPAQDMSPAPGPSSAAASLRASANDDSLSCTGSSTPQYPMGARSGSDASNYGAELFKENSTQSSILFAGLKIPRSDAIVQNDMMVLADIGFSNKKPDSGGAPPNFMAAMSVPLLSLDSTYQRAISYSDPGGKEREPSLSRERSPSRERLRYPTSQVTSVTSSRENSPPKSPNIARPASLSGSETPAMRGYHPADSARGTPHGHLQTALSSPHASVAGSGNGSARGKRQGSNMLLSGPLSARGINPERHPALHEKEVAEMKRLVQVHCQDAAEVLNRTSIKCLWCHQIFMCPPYRPQSFYFKDTREGDHEHDGHYWTCQVNPNVSLQQGKGVPVGDGKVLI